MSRTPRKYHKGWTLTAEEEAYLKKYSDAYDQALQKLQAHWDAHRPDPDNVPYDCPELQEIVTLAHKRYMKAMWDEVYPKGHPIYRY